MVDKVMSNAQYGKDMDAVAPYPDHFKAVITVSQFGESTGSITVTATNTDLLGERLRAVVDALF